MARKFYALGIFVLAAACGVIGYQALTFYFYDHWPAVPLAFVVTEIFGTFPKAEWQWADRCLSWTGKLPVSAVGFGLSYILLLLSDLLRGESRRQDP